MLMSCLCQPCSDNEFIIPFKISTARKTWQRRYRWTGWSAHLYIVDELIKYFYMTARMWTEMNNNGMLGTVALDYWGCGRQVVPHWRFLRGEDVGAASYCRRRRRRARRRNFCTLHSCYGTQCNHDNQPSCTIHARNHVCNFNYHAKKLLISAFLKLCAVCFLFFLLVLS